MAAVLNIPEAVPFNPKDTIKVETFELIDEQVHDAQLLISSPYTSPSHLLDLNRLDTPQRLFAKALTALVPIREDYATAPYVDSFNWPTVITLLRELVAAEKYDWKTTAFYVVIFRSKLNPDVDRNLLGLLDERSHEEATTSGGLLKYWFGSPNAERRNLATCLWHSREDARNGGTGPWHAKARAAARGFYEQIRFSVHKFEVSDGVGDWRFEDWE